LVQDQLASTTQVCAYDRAGMGWSESGPDRPRTPARIAEELRLLLDGAGIKPPYVLVGHSLAGKNIRMFAFAHPEDVVGMVLIDARSERIDMQASASDADGLTGAFRAQGAEFSIARRLGLARLFGASLLGQPDVAGEMAVKMALFQTQPSAVTETVSEGAARAADDELLARTSLGDLPLVVIAAEQNMAGLPGWADAQQGLSQLSTKGQLVVAKGSGHYVQLEQPQLVIDAVQTVITASQREL
jgi:pimeloyl-ACP methyl ester carboxylesterase